jgi:hypothetical protein
LSIGVEEDENEKDNASDDASRGRLIRGPASDGWNRVRSACGCGSARLSRSWIQVDEWILGAADGGACGSAVRT